MFTPTSPPKPSGNEEEDPEIAVVKDEEALANEEDDVHTQADDSEDSYHVPETRESLAPPRTWRVPMIFVSLLLVLAIVAIGTVGRLRVSCSSKADPELFSPGDGNGVDEPVPASADDPATDIDTEWDGKEQQEPLDEPSPEMENPGDFEGAVSELEERHDEPPPEVENPEDF